MEIDELRNRLRARLTELLDADDVVLEPDLDRDGHRYPDDHRYEGEGYLGERRNGNELPLFLPWRCTAQGAKRLGDLRGDAGGTMVVLRGVTVVPTGGGFESAVHYVDWLEGYHQLGPFVSGRRVVDPGR